MQFGFSFLSLSFLLHFFLLSFLVPFPVFFPFSFPLSFPLFPFLSPVLSQFPSFLSYLDFLSSSPFPSPSSSSRPFPPFPSPPPVPLSPPPPSRSRQRGGAGRRRRLSLPLPLPPHSPLRDPAPGQSRSARPGPAAAPLPPCPGAARPPVRRREYSALPHAWPHAHFAPPPRLSPARLIGITSPTRVPSRSHAVPSPPPGPFPRVPPRFASRVLGGLRGCRAPGGLSRSRTARAPRRVRAGVGSVRADKGWRAARLPRTSPRLPGCGLLPASGFGLVWFGGAEGPPAAGCLREGSAGRSAALPGLFASRCGARSPPAFHRREPRSGIVEQEKLFVTESVKWQPRMYGGCSHRELGTEGLSLAVSPSLSSR